MMISDAKYKVSISLVRPYLNNYEQMTTEEIKLVEMSMEWIPIAEIVHLINQNGKYAELNAPEVKKNET